MASPLQYKSPRMSNVYGFSPQQAGLSSPKKGPSPQSNLLKYKHKRSGINNQSLNMSRNGIQQQNQSPKDSGNNLHDRQQADQPNKKGKLSSPQPTNPLGIMNYIKSKFSGQPQSLGGRNVEQDNLDGYWGYLEETNEDDYIDHPKFEFMSPLEKDKTVKDLWKKAFSKSKAAAMLLSQINNLKSKIELFGRKPSKLLLNNQLDFLGDKLGKSISPDSAQLARTMKKKNLENAASEKPAFFIIMPDHKFKIFWNLVIIVLLIYTATFVPYQIAFIQDDIEALDILDYVTDALFGLDIIVNFISAYELANKTVETRTRNIVQGYLKSWFILDFLAVMPFSQIFSVNSSTSSNAKSPNYQKLLRLARLPRLYRLIRILRLFKVMRFLKYNQTVQRLMDKIKLNAGVSRMILTLIFAFFSVHLISCFWFMAAKFNDFSHDTWVARLNLQDKSNASLYLECLYWALQTVATVGYGDFGAITVPELFLSLVWMIFGVGFYSFVIGNLTSILANENQNSENLYVSDLFINVVLQNKLKALEEFAKKTNLPEDLHFKIRQFLENNYHELFSRIDEDDLLKELPTTLREDVLFYRFHGLFDSLDFLKTYVKKDFVWQMVQMLRKIKVDKDDVIYWEGDFSEEVYFIKTGKVKLYAKNGFPFFSYKEGQHFGDSDVMFRDTRDGKAVAQTDCLFYSLHKDQLEKLCEQFPEMKLIFTEQARKKKESHTRRKGEAEKKNPYYGRLMQGANFFAQSKLQKFGFENKQPQQDSQGRKNSKILNQEFLERQEGGGTDQDKQDQYSDNLSQKKGGDRTEQRKLKEKRIDEEMKVSQASMTQITVEDETTTKEKKEDHATSFLKIKKERLNGILSNMDSASDFTKNVSSLLSHENHQLQSQQQLNHGRNIEIDKKLHQQSKFQSQKEVDFLKKEFAQRNKVSTMESYEKKRNDSIGESNRGAIMSDVNQATNATGQDKQQESGHGDGGMNSHAGGLSPSTIKDIIEHDQNVGDVDAEQALEILARFNEDMSMLALNVYQIYNLFDLVSKENEEIIGWMHTLERQTINVEEKHLKIERKIDQLLGSLK